MQQQSKDQQLDQHHSVFCLKQQVGMHQTLLTRRSQAWEMGTGNKPFSVSENTVIPVFLAQA
jgi:hypothetical protein